MNRLADVTNRPMAMVLAGFLAGLILGLPVLGWWLWPVEYVDGDPANLRADYKAEYVHMAVDSYALTKDTEKARERAAAVGAGIDEILQDIESTGSTQDALNAAGFRDAAGVAPSEGTVPPEAEEDTPSSAVRGYLSLLPYLCTGVIVLALLGGGFLFLRRVNRGESGGRTADSPVARVEHAVGVGMAGDPPMHLFTTSYQLGDDQYEDTFSIDSPAGSFLGECGVELMETIGVGAPKKVTAFEVWLFDKVKIQTVTKVLMSEHAYRNEALRSRLSEKGMPVLAQPGESMTMETESLRVTARVVDMAYGTGPMPPSSFFERLTVEIAIWEKPQVG